MSINTKSILPILVILFLLMGCANTTKKVQTKSIISLKNRFSKDFLIGAAVNDLFINKKDTLAMNVVTREYNTITPENVMKWMNIHPKSDSFNFKASDAYVNWGKKNNLYVLGHTLVWHSQLAEYMNAITDSTVMKKELKSHINTVVNRYKGKIDAWDVVNEALNEDGTLRESNFLKVLGENYIATAFGLAEKADPKVKLLYNDYNLYNPKKRAGVIKLVKQLQEQGIRIDGVGMQGHWSLTSPSLKEIESSIIAYSELGVKVSITELDITVLPNPWDLKGAEISQNFEGSPYMNPYPAFLPDSIQMQLAMRYQDIFKLFLKHQDKIERVTFWGVTDGGSWLNDWPIKRKNKLPTII